MKYEEALKLWGLKKLQEAYPKSNFEFILDTVKVEMYFVEGYVCCGGSDPDCYCSLAESPSAYVKISANVDDPKRPYVLSTSIPEYLFDFVTVLKEIVEAGNGSIST